MFPCIYPSALNPSCQTHDTNSAASNYTVTVVVSEDSINFDLFSTYNTHTATFGYSVSAIYATLAYTSYI